MTAIEMHEVAEPYIRRRAIRHMEKGRVVILAAGTGNPYFTTDTAAALRALELDADVLLMAKNRVDGVYTADPQRRSATRNATSGVSHQEALERNLQVMDASALALCRDNDLPILVFDMSDAGAIEAAVDGEPVGTMVSTRCRDRAMVRSGDSRIVSRHSRVANMRRSTYPATDAAEAGLRPRADSGGGTHDRGRDRVDAEDPHGEGDGRAAPRSQHRSAPAAPRRRCSIGSRSTTTER